MSTSHDVRPPTPRGQRSAARARSAVPPQNGQTRLESWLPHGRARKLTVPNPLSPECGARVPGASEGVGSWAAAVDRYVRHREAEGLIGRRWVQGLRYTLNRLPVVWSRLGVDPLPTGPADLVPQHMTVLRERAGWERSTLQFYYSAARGFARWGRNGIAEDRGVWRLPSGVARRRRWLTRAQLQELLRSASDRARLLVALEGFNGLRRVEVLRLRARDVGLADGLLNVLGKGRMGGKWRQVPLHRVARAELERTLRGKNPEDRILPLSASGADNLLRGAAIAAGFEGRGVRISHHDLRRSFGRLANAAGMDLIQLKNLYGHASIDMTVHYVGLDMDRMRSGLDRFERFMGSGRGHRPITPAELDPAGRRPATTEPRSRKRA